VYLASRKQCRRDGGGGGGRVMDPGAIFCGRAVANFQSLFVVTPAASSTLPPPSDSRGFC